MAKITLIFSVVYILMGIFSYVLSGKASMTALIPSFFGVFYAIFASLSLWKPKLNKHMLHASMTLTILALGGTFKGFMKLIKWFGGEEFERLLAIQVQGAFFVLSAILLGLGINSFIQARKNRSNA